MSGRIAWPKSQFIAVPVKGDRVTTAVGGTVHEIRHVGVTLVTFMCASTQDDHRKQFWLTQDPVNCIDCLARMT